MGKSPAIDAAKTVVASANRLMEVRHFWFSSSRIAEMKVPACPIPIHHTKFVMGKTHHPPHGNSHTPPPPPPAVCFAPPNPHPRGEQETDSNPESAESQQGKPKPSKPKQLVRMRQGNA